MGVRKSRAEWTAILRAFERSGETQEAFCDRRGVNAGTFRGRLYASRRSRAAEAAAIQVLPVDVVAATMLERAPVASELVLSVGHVEVRVPIGADPRYVAALVAELGRC